MPKRKYRVYVVPAAYDKMCAHVRFLAQVNVGAAKRLYDALCTEIDSLEDTPDAYPQYFPQKPIDATLRYTLCKKRYRIVFETVGYEVYIYDIQDCRQDTDKNFV